MMTTRVMTRFGKETPESPAGSMVGCRFATGFCNTREGAAFQWTPNPKQEYCGHKLVISDQGYGIAFTNRNKRSSSVDDLTNFVTSNQLASQLLAVEEAVLETTAAWFTNNFMSWCSSFNAVAAATRAAVASNPTLAARQMLNKENIFARYIGNDVLSLQYVTNKTLYSLDPFTLTLKSNSDFQLMDLPFTTALGAVPQEHLIFHNLVIISTNGDPSSGPLALNDIKEAITFWQQAKWLWELIFNGWTILTNIVVTLIVGTAIVMILVSNILTPYLPFKRNTQPHFERPQSPEVQKSDYVSITERLRSPRINTLSGHTEYFSAVVPLKANGINCWALIDTGASFTVAGQNILHLLGMPKLQEPSSQTAVGLGGNEVRMAGSAVVKFQIGSHVLFQNTHFTTGQCTPGGHHDYDFIIGNDALARLPRFVLDYANGIFELGNDRVSHGQPAEQSIFPQNQGPRPQRHRHSPTIGSICILRTTNPQCSLGLSPDLSVKHSYIVQTLFQTLLQSISDNFPLTRIDTILEKVGGSRYFSSLDMANGYLQLRLDAASSYKCGFITESKVYAYTHLPFGLRSAASYFQRALKTVLAGLEEEALVYIDDILVYSKTFEKHVQSLRKVLDRKQIKYPTSGVTPALNMQTQAGTSLTNFEEAKAAIRIAHTIQTRVGTNDIDILWFYKAPSSTSAPLTAPRDTNIQGRQHRDNPDFAVPLLGLHRGRQQNQRHEEQAHSEGPQQSENRMTHGLKHHIPLSAPPFCTHTLALLFRITPPAPGMKPHHRPAAPPHAHRNDPHKYLHIRSI
ncbi:unnamed protein product [Caenorhabditis nigoni]